MKKREMRAASRRCIIGMLRFARDASRGHRFGRGCVGARKRAKLCRSEWNRGEGAIQCARLAELITAASARRCRRLFAEYAFVCDAALANEAACLEATQEVW